MGSMRALEMGFPVPEKRLTKSLGTTSRSEVDAGGGEFALRSTTQPSDKDQEWEWLDSKRAKDGKAGRIHFAMVGDDDGGGGSDSTVSVCSQCH
jgi:hypothetical protein